MRIVLLGSLAALLAACQSGEPRSESKPATARPGAEQAPAHASAPSVDDQIKQVNQALREAELVAPASLPPDEDAWWTPAAKACPEGATLHGAPPPNGIELWCALPDGRKHGRATKWGKMGTRLADGEHRKGVKHGRFTAYHGNGHKSMSVTFADGREHGEVTTWHANGQKALEGEYRNGAGHGPWTKWDADGQKIAEGTY